MIPGHLPTTHRVALEWFVNHQGQTTGWPIVLADGTLLANRAKGIYKPAWSEYALSVKQTINSPYSDRAPKFGDNGEWTYLYYQEEQEGKHPDNLSSNRAMLACMRDEIPVGVLRQISPKPNVKYSVLGIARIIGRAAGYFMLEGLNEADKNIQTGRGTLSYSEMEIPSGIFGNSRSQNLEAPIGSSAAGTTRISATTHGSLWRTVRCQSLQCDRCT